MVLFQTIAEMVWDLVQSGVPVDSVDDVIHGVCAAFGITVQDNMEIMNTECDYYS